MVSEAYDKWPGVKYRTAQLEGQHQDQMIPGEMGKMGPMVSTGAI